MTNLHTLTASELGPLYKHNHISPVEVTKEIINRIEKVNPVINAYITTVPEVALAQAKKAEQEMISGNYKGPLHGIPIGIKDNFDTKGIRTTVGSKLLSENIPSETAFTVKKLMDAGGIMLGKLSMHEFGGGLTNTNPVYGHVRNPWNINHVPGGSSGGSGAALAAGMATLATGTDTFGSIRVPASMCGVYGLKPTYGLISTTGVAPLAWSLDHPGPMARSVSDLALMLQYMTGHDPEDPASLKVPSPQYSQTLNQGIQGLKVGIPTAFLEGLDPEVSKLFNQAVNTLKNLGAEVKEIKIPELSLASFASYVVTTGEASAYHYEWLQTKSEQYAPDVRIFFQAGAVTTSPQYVRAQQIRRELIKAIKNAFQEVDVLVGPSVPITTPRFSENWDEQNLEITRKSMPFTAPPALSGIPSLAVPMGLCSCGVPVGMQFMGNHLSEQLLLQVASAWEQTDPLRVTM
ncbi:Asp-tRNA(Asn)/Glu-tRNA(Gln) amidotransferase GatCAB subunit A [Bacillus alkalicellulosilyticus]|uniref:Asp-tRNA(Asn)/Glu-tRNA(Gln) amidotransferase GatCAB subunit A n=1 Tax=Alkalihalobacterium alkalicellulosilyticum TaxID=1912214 RepID=UPI0009980F5A|nr:Asp-tRNA(Asn)/Glu-tRNA(Gln) amidotransferase GatCAB subunit A [Bacillus alkalicellulosilyticus]